MLAAGDPVEPLAQATQLGLSYGSKVVLRDVNLDVNPGEVLGLIGPNGGGKSTLLLTLAGLIRPTTGSVTVRGTPAHRMALDASGAVGLITTTPGLYPLLTGWENLEFFGALYGLSKAETRSRVADFVALLGIGHHLTQRVSAGSSGMQQKISLARALLMTPDLLLLDEPTANLDPLSADIIFRTARAHADAGHAVVWVTHDLHAAETVCDRVALIRQTVHTVETFEHVRDVPEPTQLMQTWRGLLGDAA